MGARYVPARFRPRFSSQPHRVGPPRDAQQRDEHPGAFRCFGDAVDQARAELLCVSGRPGSPEEISGALAVRQRHGRYANMGPPKLASGTLRNPAGMVTLALAMLPGVGGSKRMSSRTVPRRGLPTTAWLQLLQITRTGRYVDGSTYIVT